MDRKQVALIYTNSKGWIGGTYYVQNLVCSLNLLDDVLKPNLNIYCDSEQDFEDLKNFSRYPYLFFKNISFKCSKFRSYVNKIKRKFSPYHYVSELAIKKSLEPNVFVYPVLDRAMVADGHRTLCWIPDLQEKHYPEFFSKSQLHSRYVSQISIIKNQLPIVFSSNSAKKDFYEAYADKNIYSKTYILPFAVTHRDFSKESIEKLRQKYGICTKKYFFCANQFWQHKNHLFLFRVFEKFLKQNPTASLVCSGNLEDHRNPEYINRVKNFLAESKMSPNVKILGFIPREEQLCLMANSYAIIQPSLFEGWSTTVEDAKALGKFIFLSNIDVHLEQNPTNVCYFDPMDENDLLTKLITVEPTQIYHNYRDNVKKFALSFLSIINDFNG